MIRNFVVQELVPKHIFLKRGLKSWQLLDWRAIKTLEWVRDHLGQTTVNNWHVGGNYSQSGLRTFEIYMQGGDLTPDYIAHIKISESLSQHKFGRAFDCKLKNHTAEEAREYIKNNWDLFGLGWAVTLEEDVGWLHFDCRTQPDKKVYTFKP